MYNTVKNYYITTEIKMIKKRTETIAENAKVNEEDRQRLIKEWNATESSYPKELCVHHLFKAQV